MNEQGLLDDEKSAYNEVRDNVFRLERFLKEVM
jgi:hypothetical protein